MLSFLACSRAKENSGIVNSEHASSEVVEVIRNGLSFNYQSCGEGDTTLLLVHGWCIDQSYWSSQIEAFCGEYKVVSMELAGFSTIQEARKSWTIEEYGQDVIALIDYLALEHVVLVGHSMGGDIILEAALARPEEVIGFVGVDNFKDVGKAYSKEEQDEIAQFINMLESDFSNVAPAYAQSVLFHTSTDSSIIRRVSQDFASANPEVAVKSLESLLAYGQLEQEKLSKLKVKIYLINSDVTPTRRSGLEASGVAYEVLDIHATGHYPMVEKPEEFNRILRQVLAAIGAN